MLPPSVCLLLLLSPLTILALPQPPQQQQPDLQQPPQQLQPHDPQQQQQQQQPQPGAAAAAPPGVTTEKCDKQQFESFVAQQVVCITQAEYAVDKELLAQQKITVEDVKRDVCNSITAKVKCISDLGPTCFNPTQFELMHSQFVLSEFLQYAHANLTQPYETFIASCAVLKENEAKVNRFHFGAADCSFVQYLDFQQKKAAGTAAPGDKAC